MEGPDRNSVTLCGLNVRRVSLVLVLLKAVRKPKLDTPEVDMDIISFFLFFPIYFYGLEANYFTIL